MSILRYTKEYGLRLMVINSLSRVMQGLHMPVRWIDVYYNTVKHTACLNWHRKHYGSIRSVKKQTGDNPDRDIYVFWSQGIDTAPPIVKACIRSIIKHAGNHRVHILDNDSYRNFVSIPQHIEEKFRKGIIGFAHFSDVLRFNLINQRGGLWIDATCLVTQPFPEEIFSAEFYSLKDAYPNLRWTSFFFGGAPHNIITENMCDFYDRFWAHHNEAFTYLFLDYQMMMLHSDNAEIRTIIEAVPGETYPFMMLPHLGDPYKEEEYDRISSAFFVHKLSYRDLPELTTPTGDGTMLKHIIDS